VGGAPSFFHRAINLAGEEAAALVDQEARRLWPSLKGDNRLGRGHKAHADELRPHKQAARVESQFAVVR
jgi:hypothetical protein